MMKKYPMMHLSKSDFKADKWMYGRHLFIGLPMAFQFSITAIGTVILQGALNLFGSTAIAAYTAACKVEQLVTQPALSFGVTMANYSGQNLGADRMDRIRLGQRSAYLLAIGTSLIISAAMLIFGKAILGSFISGTPEEFDSALNIAYRYLQVMSLGLPLLYVLYVVRSSLQGLGNASCPFISGVAELIVRVAVAMTLPALVGTEGIFFAEILAWLAADVVLLTGWFVTLRKHT
jgi:Na+-driven multidrug efflux pump